MEIVSVSQMQDIEKAANESGISYQQMMTNAGEGVANWVNEKLPTHGNIIGLIGSGNNGGDTIIALTKLSKMGNPTTGFTLKNRQREELIDAYLETGGNIIDLSAGENLNYLQAALSPGTIILDGVLGTGLKLPLRGPLKDVMGKISHLIENSPRMRLIAVDCPSGVDCDTGQTSETTLSASDTLCMSAVKQGLLKHPAREKAGTFHKIDIGIGPLSQYITQRMPVMITKELVKTSLPRRSSAAHKGTFGTCFVIAGTESYTGAAYLVGKAAYRAGCGLVNIGTLEAVHRSLSGQLVEAVWTVLPKKDGFYDPKGISFLEDKLAQVDSLVFGPGWGIAEENVAFLERLLGIIPKDLPTIIDADGLKLLKRSPEWWHIIPSQTILTPHPGEMVVLTDLDISEIQSHRWKIAQDYAEKWGVILVLKGAETVIADSDGNLWINPISESALATAGSGDVLSGIIGGLLAQGSSLLNSAVISTWLHAQAGIIAKRKCGSDISVTAVDILESVEDVFSEIE